MIVALAASTGKSVVPGFRFWIGLGRKPCGTFCKKVLDPRAAPVTRCGITPGVFLQFLHLCGRSVAGALVGQQRTNTYVRYGAKGYFCNSCNFCTGGFKIGWAESLP